MLRSFSEEVVVNLKDRLRDVRHFVRSSRHDHPGGPRRPAAADPFAPPVEIERLLSRAASVVDDTLTVAETVSRSLLPVVRGDDGRHLHGFDSYFPTGGGIDGERLFRRDLYAALKAWQRHGGDDREPVHEANFAQVHLTIRRHHAALLTAMRAAEGEDRIDAVASIAAAVLVALLASRPFMADSEGDGLHPDLRSLAPVVLAAGIVTLSPSDMGEAELVETAAMAVDARLDRIATALAGPRPIEDVATVFSVLLAHLP
ncbi:hypothetical protein [Oryzicola mucosus]|uniref:Uncharacterized protein n=1 Tax=Oryzicola mucosus TaxID=2767425 RepID=A0A8J6PVP0_9HYPH|nr:hypothetical protein [Oryzicola mucosus]MBD0415711.1 hypothetical protein [Oryzicola mucosus]